MRISGFSSRLEITLLAEGPLDWGKINRLILAKLRQLASADQIVVGQRQQIPDPQEGPREAALKQLKMLRGKIVVGDILAPLDEEGTGDADNV